MSLEPLETREKAKGAEQNAEPEVNSEGGAEEVTNGSAGGFEDNTPINGTLVEDVSLERFAARPDPFFQPMEVKIYKPECDD